MLVSLAVPVFGLLRVEFPFFTRVENSTTLELFSTAGTHLDAPLAGAKESRAQGAEKWRGGHKWEENLLKFGCRKFLLRTDNFRTSLSQ